jgi:hypothetical protein
MWYVTCIFKVLQSPRSVTGAQWAVRVCPHLSRAGSYTRGGLVNGLAAVLIHNWQYITLIVVVSSQFAELLFTEQLEKSILYAITRKAGRANTISGTYWCPIASSTLHTPILLVYYYYRCCCYYCYYTTTTIRRRRNLRYTGPRASVSRRTTALQTLL